MLKRRNLLPIFILIIIIVTCFQLPFFRPPFSRSRLIHLALSYQRKQISSETSTFIYPASKSLSDFIPESGGTPVRNIIVSSWRSGSTFLGEILNSIPGNFYHYEPLIAYHITKSRGPPSDVEGINVVKKLFKCDYSDMENYFEYVKEREFVFVNNVRLWNKYTIGSDLIFDAEFIGSYCRLFPVQTMKVLRLSLEVAGQILEDKSLNVRMLYLVRDPRGFLNSRSKEPWCVILPDCYNFNITCGDIVADFNAAEQLGLRFPETFSTLRYEDLALDPYTATQEILKFFGLPFHENVKKFLDTHTNTHMGDQFSTYRDTKKTPFNWMKELSHENISEIQEMCREGMKLWGYKEVKKFEKLDGNFESVVEI